MVVAGLRLSLLLTLWLSLVDSAQAKSDSALDEAADLLSWLEKNAKAFAECLPKKEARSYRLCDGTEIDRRELAELFAKSPKKLKAWVRKKGLKVEILCDSDASSQPFQKECRETSHRKTFSEMTALHGKYLPEEETILIRSSASPGSLIHEYIHSLQAKNPNSVFGRRYKRERIRIQKGLVAMMDQVIAASKTGKVSKNELQRFQLASEALRAFAPWQDLIDERGIFQLYILYGKNFGVSSSDVALAKRNMRFICENARLKKLMPASQCAPAVTR